MKTLSKFDAEVLASIPRIDCLEVHKIRRKLPAKHPDKIQYLKAEKKRNGYPTKIRYYYRKDEYGIHVAFICHSHGHIILLDKKDFDRLPKLHWDVHVDSESRIYIYAYKDGRHYNILKALREMWGVKPQKNLYPLGHVLDFRRSRRTMSNIKDNVGDGRMGIYSYTSKNGKNTYWCAYECISSRQRRDLYHGPSRLDAQQAFNAFLLGYKRNNPSDMHLFGSCYVNGIRQPLFPDDYYNTQGKLKPRHFKIFKRHKVYVRECVNVLSMLDLTPLDDDPL